MLQHAQEEAEKASRTYIGTEHVLLGLLSEPDGLAAKALLALGVRSDAVRAMIEQFHQARGFLLEMIVVIILVIELWFLFRGH